MARKIIAFVGKMGSGKSTAAKILHKYGYTRVRFAGPLKAMMASLGLTQDEIEGHLKEVPCDLLGGKTPRYAMQTIGTEWGRDLIHKDLWINAWKRALNSLPEHIPVVVDDCRFANEAAAVKEAGGQIIRILRDELAVKSTHSSETEMDSIPYDYAIGNGGTIGQLEDLLRMIVWSDEEQARVDKSWADTSNAGFPA